MLLFAEPFEEPYNIMVIFVSQIFPLTIPPHRFVLSPSILLGCANTYIKIKADNHNMNKNAKSLIS